MKITQEILYNLIIDYKNNQICDIKKLDPLKVHVFQKVSYLNFDDKKNVFAEFLLVLWNSSKKPHPDYTYRYIKYRLINACVKLGFISDRRYKSGQQVQASLGLHNKPEMSISTPFTIKNCFL